ncbi:unnamed protein product [Tetraodon nigroviridis]|uniref:(spotted green pufferfish) hypothetical protein n=1 Tax=Tetraodon nigroviridis TaxID=99883 RepID=Q4T896_TETNG|nr:unnamed protein product [Tetraodon nigroviridis]
MWRGNDRAGRCLYTFTVPSPVEASCPQAGARGGGPEDPAHRPGGHGVPAHRRGRGEPPRSRGPVPG